MLQDGQMKDGLVPGVKEGEGRDLDLDAASVPFSYSFPLMSSPTEGPPHFSSSLWIDPRSQVGLKS